ncbi:MAG: nitrate/nitrite transporter NrtS [Gallionella sp.]
MNKMTADRLRAVFWSSVKVALLVGTILNIINQGGEILVGGRVVWAHIALNYCVPFCVSVYSAMKGTGFDQ